MNGNGDPYRRLSVEALTPCIGAEVGGVDLAEVDSELLAEIRHAFARHLVLIFRDQRLTRDQHKAFGRLFGELQTHPAKTHLGMPGDPEIFDIAITEKTRVANGETWHSDLSCEPVPPQASILYITEVPPSGGGDTLFANMHEAFVSLSAPMQALLEELTAFHDGFQDLAAYGYRRKPGDCYPTATHPVVIRHPDSGLPVLYVNEAFTARIEQLTGPESRALLDLLYRHIERGVRFQCRVRWAPNTVVMWDNQAVHHHAVWDYYPETRRGERVTVKCKGPPVAYAG